MAGNKGLADVIEMPAAIARTIEFLLDDNAVRQVTRESNISEHTAKKIARILAYANDYKECINGLLSNDAKRRLRGLSGIFIEYCKKTYWTD